MQPKTIKFKAMVVAPLRVTKFSTFQQIIDNQGILNIDSAEINDSLYLH